MSLSESNPVVVCGAGPVGLFCALRLSRAQIPCLLFEKEAKILETPRAIAYSPATITVLDEAGVLDDCLRIGSAQRLNCWRAPGPNGKVYAVNDWIVTKDVNKYPYSLMIGQHKLAAVYLDHCKAYPTTRVFFRREVVALTQNGRDDCVQLKVKNLDTEEIEDVTASYVVGADGGRSFIRKAIGQSLAKGFTYDEVFVAANIYFPFNKYPTYAKITRNFLVDHKDWAVVARTGPPGDPWRVAYGEDTGLTDEEVRKRAPERLKRLLPGDDKFEIVQLQQYRVHQRRVERYRVGRVLLAGDAAHLNNPIGGMGLTSGLTDAACLSDALVAHMSGQSGDKILEEYSQKRIEVFDTVTNPTSQNMKKLVQSTPEEVEELERTYFKQLNEDEAFSREGLMKGYALLTRLEGKTRSIEAQL